MDRKLEVVPIPVSDVDRAMKVYESLGWRLDPHRVDMRTTDSNLWGSASGHTYTLTPKPDGTTDVDVVVVRDGKNFKGRVLGGLLGVIGKRVLCGELAKTAQAIEARNRGATATGPG